MRIKQIISSLFLASLGLISFNACSDVPAPYEIPEAGNSSIYGDGTIDKPYSVKGAMLNQNGKLSWVKAFIVGYIPQGEDIQSTISDVVFGTENAAETNMVVAISADSKDINNCLAVQLPSGTMRSSLNLKTNPQNLGQEVMLLGTMEKYFGGSGIKNVQAYILNGDTVGDIPAEQEQAEAIFKETFASSKGDFEIKNVNVPAEMGSEVWTWDTYKYMKATSFVNQTDYPAESWLISPEIDLSKAKNATLTFEYVARYFTNLKDNITLWVTESNTENWQQLTIPNHVLQDTWTPFQKSGDIDLNAFKGKKVKVAFKYACTEKAGTYELKNIAIEDRAAGETPQEPETPVVNESSKEKPFSVSTAIQKYDATKPMANAWVKGFIVGYVGGKSIDGAVLNDLSAITDENKTNILIAEKADETDYKNCLVLQLPSGAVREALNLKDNPGNLGKELTVKGSLEKYFGTYGLKSVSEYVLNGQGSVTPPTPEEPQGDAILSESFDNTFGSFTAQSVLGDQAWKADKFNDKPGYLKMSAFVNGASLANEDWLVSPAIDLSKERTLTFDQAIGPANQDLSNAADQYTVWVSSDYTNDVQTATWTQVNITYPAASGWSFTTTTAKLPAVGKNARVAFKYKNEAGAKTITWEINNLSIR